MAQERGSTNGAEPGIRPSPLAGPRALARRTRRPPSGFWDPHLADENSEALEARALRPIRVPSPHSQASWEYPISEGPTAVRLSLDFPAALRTLGKQASHFSLRHPTGPLLIPK